MEGPRPARPEEFDRLMEMIDGIFAGGRRCMREGFPLLFNMDNLQNLFVVVEGGRPVSHVGVLIRDVYLFGCRLTTASVGSVGTLEEYRGRGLAGACLEAAEKSAVAQGASVTLISGRRNLYTRFGALQVGLSLVADVPAGDAGRGLTVRRAAAADVALLQSLHEREPVRFHRPLEDWQAMLRSLEARSRGKNDHAVFVVERDGEPVAYVFASHFLWDEGPHTRVEEFAGCRPSIVAALPAVAAALGAETIQMRAPDWDSVLVALLGAGEYETREEHLSGHTVKVSSVENFLQQLRPLIEERVGRSAADAFRGSTDAAGLYECWVGEERLTFEPPAFTALAFGQPSPGDEERDRRGVLERIFPVPLPLPGLNYV